MSQMGRPTSVGIRFNTFSAIGVNRRMRRSQATITMAICTQPSRFTRSLLTRIVLRAPLQLLVERAEFLVGALQFFLRGVQFLVGALQFLVAGEYFLVGRLQFFIGRFEVLDDRLQIFATGGQLLFEPCDVRSPLARFGTGAGRFSPAISRTCQRISDFAAGGALVRSWNRIRKCRPSGAAAEQRPALPDPVEGGPAS